MPFAAQIDLNDENDPNKKNQAGGVNVSGSSTSFATNVPGQEASSGGSSGSQAKSSGQYTNIQNYLDANKDQADGMGQKIYQDVSQKADDASQKITSLNSQAPSVQAYDPNAIINNATQASDQDKAQYKEMKKTGGYAGPQSLDQMQGYQDTAKAATDATQLVKNAGSETGQQALLKSAYGRPQYSAGENKLDQVLLQNSQGSRANLENIVNKYSGLENLFKGTQESLGNSINAATTQAQANREAFIPAETQARNALLNPIQKRADDMNANNSGYIDRVTGDLSDDVLSDETLKALGLSEGQSLYDLNLGNYVTPDRSQIGLDNAATAEERQKYAALASLFDDPTMSQISADGKAASPISFDQAKFNKDLAARQAEYQTSKAKINQQVDQSWLDAIRSQLSYNGIDGERAADLIDHDVYAPFGDEYGRLRRTLESIKQSNGDQRRSQLAANDQTFGINRTIKKG